MRMAQNVTFEWYFEAFHNDEKEGLPTLHTSIIIERYILTYMNACIVRIHTKVNRIQKSYICLPRLTQSIVYILFSGNG